MSGKGKEVQFYGGELGYRGQVPPQFYGGELGYSGQVPPPTLAEEDYYWEDGVPYRLIGSKDSRFPNRKHMMTERERAAYTKKVAESEGYDVDIEGNFVALGGISRVLPETDYPRWQLDQLAKLALKEYNKDQGTRLELHGSFKKANRGMCGGGLKYYITFDVADPDDDASPVKTFQAQVVCLFQKGHFRVDQVRPKPTTTTTA